MERKLMRTSEFAKKVGLHPHTVRKLVKEGELSPVLTPSGQYRFTEEHVKQVLEMSKPKVVIYARVFSEKGFLEKQVREVKKFWEKEGLTVDEVITDVSPSFELGTGMLKLLNRAFKKRIRKILVYTDDRLSLTAFPILERVFKNLGVEILNTFLEPKEEIHLRDVFKEVQAFQGRVLERE